MHTILTYLWERKRTPGVRFQMLMGLRASHYAYHAIPYFAIWDATRIPLCILTILIYHMGIPIMHTYHTYLPYGKSWPVSGSL